MRDRAEHQSDGQPDAGEPFPPDSVMKRVSGESVGLLAGGRAILMQLAHPMIAAGVIQHSNYRDDRLGRLERTLDISLGMVFGDRGQTREAMRRFHAIHGPISGQLPEEAGRFPAGAAYRAHDPALKLWVHATLVDSSLLVYRLFIGRLSRAELREYYRDSRLLARMYGIPDSMIPPTLEDFRRYMAGMLAGDDLAVTRETRELGMDVIHPRVWIVPRTGAALARFVTAGLLPARLRTEYGLPWDARRQAALDALCRASRALVPRIPPSIRLFPQAGGSNLVYWIIGKRHNKPSR